MKKGLNRILHMWWPILLAVSIVCFVANVILFYPGYMSPDSLSQLCQAKGDCELNTWHPVSMALVWRLLIAISDGRIGSMVIFQTILLCGALFLLSNYVWIKTRSKRYSLLIIATGLFPHIWSLSGVVWKDVQMAVSLLASFSLILSSKLTTRKRLKYSLWIAALLLLIYAVSVRTNAFLAALPIIYFLVHTTDIYKKVWQVIVTTIVLVIAIFFIGLNFYKITNLDVIESNASVSMYVYDIVNVYDSKEIQQKAPHSIRDSLLDMSPCSYNSKSGINLEWWNCIQSFQYDKEQYQTLKGFWRKAVLDNPTSYIRSKLATAWLFLTATPYIAPSGISAENSYNVQVKFPSSVRINQRYMENTYKYFPFLFSGWFWLLTSSLLFVFSLRGENKNRTHARLIRVLSFSSILYSLPMLAGNLTPDYRYFYWSAIAATLAIALLLFANKKIPCGKAK